MLTLGLTRECGCFVTGSRSAVASKKPMWSGKYSELLLKPCRLSAKLTEIKSVRDRQSEEIASRLIQHH